MITTVMVTKPVAVRQSVICNRCKAEARFEGDDIFRAQDYLSVSCEYGYGSSHFGDGTRIAFDLCEACTAWLTSQFQIAAVVREG